LGKRRRGGLTTTFEKKEKHLKEKRKHTETKRSWQHGLQDKDGKWGGKRGGTHVGTQKSLACSGRGKKMGGTKGGK